MLNNFHHYTFNSLSLFWLAKSVHWIFKISAWTSFSCRLYNNHVFRTLKVTGNHVVYDHGAWFLRVIMPSLHALCCLPSVKKQKHDFQVCFVDRARHGKNSWKQGLTKHKKVDKGGKGAVRWLREREKTERYFHTIRNKLSVSLTVGTNFFYSMHNKTIIFYYMSR